MDNPADQSAAYPADFNGPAGRLAEFMVIKPTNCTCRAGCTGAVYNSDLGHNLWLDSVCGYPRHIYFHRRGYLIASGLYTVHRERLRQADELADEKQRQRKLLI